MARLRDVIGRGTLAARPAAASTAVGALYYTTDTTTWYRNNGVTWDEQGVSASTASATGSRVFAYRNFKTAR